MAAETELGTAGAITKFFEEKGYGFARTDDGKIVFVHVKNIVFAEPTETGTVAFTQFDLPFRRTGGPTVGFRVLLCVEKNDKGFVATAWTSEEQTIEAQAKALQMKAAGDERFRVMEQWFTGEGAGKPAPRLEATRRTFEEKHPLLCDSLQDEFRPEKIVSTYTVWHWWERYENGRWVRCQDPRKPLDFSAYNAALARLKKTA